MKKMISFTAVLAIAVSSFCAYARNDVLYETAAYVRTTVAEPKVGSIGGEWAVVGLARSGADISDSYFSDYYDRVVDYVTERGGKLHDRKFTEYSRLIIALTAIGRDPRNVGGYDLLKPLGDFDKVNTQGINGPVFALIALDTADYDMPRNPFAEVQATREMYVDEILSRQNENGGFALTELSEPDVDVTAMTVTALSGYMSNTAVSEAVDRSLSYLSEKQDENGGFGSAEGAAQTLVAMSALGISQKDERFVKNGNTVYDALLSFRTGGGFSHNAGGEVNEMATEQALYALCAYDRAAAGQKKLYNMTDVEKLYKTEALEDMEKALEHLRSEKSEKALEILKRIVGLI